MSKPPTILFICPHGAAKSVLAYLVSGSPSSRDFVASAFRRKKGGEGAGAGHFRLKAEATRHLSSEPISVNRYVLASAYFQRLAKERGLNVQVASAGTEPDATARALICRLLRRVFPCGVGETFLEVPP